MFDENKVSVIAKKISELANSKEKTDVEERNLYNDISELIASYKSKNEDIIDDNKLIAKLKAEIECRLDTREPSGFTRKVIDDLFEPKQNKRVRNRRR